MIKLSRKGLFMKLKIIMTLLFAAFLFSSLDNSIEKALRIMKYFCHVLLTQQIMIMAVTEMVLAHGVIFRLQGKFFVIIKVKET